MYRLATLPIHSDCFSCLAEAGEMTDVFQVDAGFRNGCGRFIELHTELIGIVTMAKVRSKAPANPVAPAGSDGKLMLENAVGQIEKMFGQGSIMKLNSAADFAGVAGISTGALSLDLALGGRGFPRGRIIEVYGPESSGKMTWLCMRLPVLRRLAASQLSSTQNMLLTHRGLVESA